MQTRRISALVAVVIVALLAAASAEARKPIVSYLDGGVLKLHDLELGADVPAPAITIPGMVPRYALSLDGRYVLWLDDAVPKRLHLYDRASDAEVALPGIDVYMNPGGLTVSSTGLIGFDDNGNGPALVYDSGAGAFVETGLDAMNGHRQTKLSGDGRLLATTCVTGCEVDLGSDASAYVQDLAAKADTAFPDDLTGADDEDEEHPCINADGSLVGVDITNPMQRDVFLYDRAAGALVAIPGLNDPVKDDTYCILDSAGDYVGYSFDNSEFRIYERSSGTLLTLPPLPFSNTSSFTDPYPPPGGKLDLTVSGKKKQRLRGGRPKIKVKVGCDADCDAVAKGKVVAKLARRGERRAAEKVPLKKAKASIDAGERKVLKLRLGSSSADRLDRLARDGATLKAEIKIRATSDGDAAKKRFRVKLST